MFTFCTKLIPSIIAAELLGIPSTIRTFLFPIWKNLAGAVPLVLQRKSSRLLPDKADGRGPTPSEDPVPMRLRLFGQRDSQPLEWLFARQKWHFSILGVIEFLDDLRNFLLLESSVTALQFRKVSADLFSCYLLWEYFCCRGANKFHLGFSYM